MYPCRPILTAAEILKKEVVILVKKIKDFFTPVFFFLLIFVVINMVNLPVIKLNFEITIDQQTIAEFLSDRFDWQLGGCGGVNPMKIEFHPQPTITPTVDELCLPPSVADFPEVQTIEPETSATCQPESPASPEVNEPAPSPIVYPPPESPVKFFVYVNEGDEFPVIMNSLPDPPPFDYMIIGHQPVDSPIVCHDYHHGDIDPYFQTEQDQIDQLIESAVDDTRDRQIYCPNPEDFPMEILMRIHHSDLRLSLNDPQSRYQLQITRYPPDIQVYTLYELHTGHIVYTASNQRPGGEYRDLARVLEKIK